MRKFLHVWRSIGAFSFVLSVIKSGYKLPFVSIPVKYFFSNHKSAVDNRAFVCEAIEQLLLAGSAVVVKRDQVHVCSPLGVVPKKNGKLRLILDLRFLNKHLAKRKFKFEDLRVVAEILQPDDCFFTFDLRNGYHHVDIFSRALEVFGFFVYLRWEAALFFVLFAFFWFKYVSLRFHQIAETSCCIVAVARH